MRMIQDNKTNTSTPTTNMAGKTKTYNEWIIHSDASEHITYSKTLFKDDIQKDINSTSVTISNGGMVKVKGVGDIHISYGFDLNDALNVPVFKCNLLSISKLASYLQCSITFFPKICFI